MNPYLPLNPCCSDVTVNTPCGCSSVATHTSCNNLCGTNFPVSSNIIYNGPELTCTLIAPCDTVNVALQKADAIICSLVDQVNDLTLQVETLTSEIININEELVTIFNVLDSCCTTTTTTTIL
jgi:hypothetical protein